MTISKAPCHCVSQAPYNSGYFGAHAEDFVLTRVEFLDNGRFNVIYSVRWDIEVRRVVETLDTKTGTVVEQQGYNFEHPYMAYYPNGVLHIQTSRPYGLKKEESTVKGARGDYLENHPNGVPRIQGWVNDQGNFEGPYTETYDNKEIAVTGTRNGRGLFYGPLIRGDREGNREIYLADGKGNEEKVNIPGTASTKTIGDVIRLFHANQAALAQAVTTPQLAHGLPSTSEPSP